MTTERPASERVLPPTLNSVPTPRSGVPAAGFGVSAIASREVVDVTPTDEPERRSRAVTIAGALLAAVVLAAVVVAFRIVVPTTPTAAAEASAAAAAATDTRERPGSVVMFGQPHAYGDGLEIAVNPVQRYEPSSNATGVDEGIPVRLQVVMTNRTDAEFRPNTLQMSATSAGEPGVAVWDPDQGIALTGPDVSVPPGSSIHFYLAFAVADPGDVELEVTPALFGYGPTVVTHS